ncbi:MAG TPA: hypothetical protein VLW45_10740 [Pelomicrobium sp.]|nr:hypothetical protein [Pelomicrobium sp.]
MIRRVGALALVCVLGGCAVSHVSPENPTVQIPDRSAEIRVGQTDRAGVRGILGAPRLNSDYWGFDLFRADTEQAEVVIAVTPVPVPFARVEDKLLRYTLVAYDAGGKTTGLASGVFRRPTSWRSGSPISSDYPALHLRVGDLLFFVDPEGARDVNLLAAPGLRDAYLARARASRHCTVVLGCKARGCPDQWAADGAPARRLPLRTAEWYWIKADEREDWLRGVEPHTVDGRTAWLEVLVAIKLPAGERLFEFSARHLGGKASLPLTCRPGDVSYVTIDAVHNQSFWSPALVDWQFERTQAMPARFERRALVLVEGGEWYVDAEPGK